LCCTCTTPPRTSATAACDHVSSAAVPIVTIGNTQSQCENLMCFTYRRQ
jgi:hypothetical protein